MLAMHYQFELPADYDMRIIRDRIAARGSVFENMEGLVFKQFLMADFRSDSPTNLYAPVYLWSSTAAAWHFLRGPLFSALCASFWKPRVQIGLVSSAPRRSEIQAATVLHRTAQMLAGTVAPSLETPLEVPRESALVWLDPNSWTRTILQAQAAGASATPAQAFEVVHLARGSDWGALA